jgi:hypothetical protein
VDVFDGVRVREHVKLTGLGCTGSFVVAWREPVG